MQLIWLIRALMIPVRKVKISIIGYQTSLLLIMGEVLVQQ